MSSRRAFLKQITAAGAAMSTSVLPAQRAFAGEESPSTGTGAYKSIPRIKSVIRREETTLRLGGMGDNFHMSWGADDRQFVAVCDGLEWTEKPNVFYNSRLYTISGGPHDAVFEEVRGYPPLISILKTENIMRYYGFGTLALDGNIYQFLGTPNHRFTRADSSPWPDARFVGAKLIYSTDYGRTWRNQDGSEPVVWEHWQHRSRRNMTFFEEPQNSFSLLSVLQMGRNYAANTDGYVYVYSPNGSTDGTMNQLVMFRVPKTHVLHRDAYEYFGGLQRGNASWVKDIKARAVVHTFPHGWVNTALHPWAWMPSVTYNIPLSLYMMASWGTGCARNGTWFAKPSYLGLWVSQNPWGPWAQIHEELAWTPRGDSKARAFAPQISPRWIAEDGKSFWLVWADFQSVVSEADLEQLKDVRKRGTSSEDTVQYYQKFVRTMPYYTFNTQRVDVVID